MRSKVPCQRVRLQGLVVAEYISISGLIREQPERSFQHFRVRLREDDTLKSIMNLQAEQIKQTRSKAKQRN